METAQAALHTWIARQVRQARVDREQRRGDRLSRALFLAAAFFATGAGASELADLADLVNRLRAPGSKCAAASGLAPLAPRPALDQAAAAYAGGVPLADSMKAGGYRAVSVQVISLSGTTERKALENLLTSRFCPTLTDAKLVDIGIHRKGNATWIVMAAPFAPGVAIGEAEAAKRMLALVNQARSEPRRCGEKNLGAAGPVQWNATLTRAARAHSEDMARQNYFSHDGRDGSKPGERVARTGYNYRATGENIAAGQMTPEDAVAGWIRSPTHCVNLMNPVFTEMGVAYATNVKSDMGVYWTQLFGTPR